MFFNNVAEYHVKLLSLLYHGVIKRTIELWSRIPLLVALILS
jgi:hypothetical protein